MVYMVFFPEPKKTRNNTVIDSDTIDDIILNDSVLKNKVEYISDRGGDFILLIKDNYESFNKNLKNRIETELGLVFDKIITDKNMLN